MPIPLIPVEFVEQMEEKPKTSKPSIPSKEIVPKIQEKSRISTFRRSITGIPVTPKDPCCAKVCDNLNKTIDRQIDVLGAVRDKHESKTYRSILYGTEALDDHRQELKDKNICKCIEETGAVGIMIPLRTEPIAQTVSYTPRGMLRIRPPEIMRGIYRKEKSTMPIGNHCCSPICELLNKEIDTNNKILDKMELRGGTYVYNSQRYEKLSYKTFRLEKYRDELKIQNICRCES